MGHSNPEMSQHWIRRDEFFGLLARSIRDQDKLRYFMIVDKSKKSKLCYEVVSALQGFYTAGRKSAGGSRHHARERWAYQKKDGTKDGVFPGLVTREKGAINSKEEFREGLMILPLTRLLTDEKIWPEWSGLWQSVCESIVSSIYEACLCCALDRYVR